MIIEPNLFSIMNYKKDKNLDVILSRCCDTGITEHKSIDRYFSTVTFGNGSEFVYWDKNKWYAWLSDGKIEGYRYQNARPSTKTMRKFRKELAGFFGKHKDTSND
ncbi:hypothetical protein RHO12_03280 [Orbus sturtevantii]|uniref:hypothetical protein n=1 Tax=Orbus sturtevantii TaxID=3074109 RepID=UPI00370DB756